MRKNKQINPIDKVVFRKKLKDNGIETYNKLSFKSVCRSVLGVSCIIVGVGTFYIPFTTIPLCIIGGGLIGIDINKYIKRFNYEFNLIKIRVLTASA